MDFLDTGKEFRERIILLVGYVLIAVAIVTGSIILVYGAYGFNFGKNGTVIQNGLVFVSSQPNPADIIMNGKYNGQTTNARLIIPSGIYQFELTRTGYRPWYRTITVDGGAVEHFDYPLLFPQRLTSHALATYSAAPGLITQSPDRRWLIIQKPGSSSDFDLYDLKNPVKPIITTLSLPSGLLGTATTSESWQTVDWADDNQHVLMEHTFDGKIEYFLLDRADPSQSVNLTTTLNLPEGDQVDFANKKYNSYFVYNPDGDLGTASLGATGVTPLLNHVLTFKTYNTNTVLYVTNDDAPAGKVVVKMMVGTNSYTIRDLPISTTYLVNLTSYGGSLYVATGASTSGRVYIYQDPVGTLSSAPGQALVPAWVLHVPAPNFLSFSDNAQFIMTEDGNYFSVYDIQNDLGYLYNENNKPLDQPQVSASWMDGDRLVYVSNGKLIVQDYDGKNQQTLVKAVPQYAPAFSTNYVYMFTLAPAATPGQYELEQTPLLTPSDL